MPTVIGTVTDATASAYSNQRKVDRCQNGVLWAAMNSSSSTAIALAYSTDNGATWTFAGGTSYVQNGSGSATNNYTRNGSFFIDIDDYAHAVFKDNSNGYIYYRRGAPNAARTAWTWSAAVGVYTSNANGNHPDVVAHREGTGWKVHVVFSYATGSTVNQTTYFPLTVASDGLVTVGTGVWNTNHGNGVHTWPSIDFNHTGDGKTVAGDTPHLYAAWSAGASGAGNGIRFRKATYSAGSWTWGTEQEIDSTRYIANDAYWLNCLFDGTRITMGGTLLDGTNVDLILYDRDAADTITTTHVLLDNSITSEMLLRGSSTYDGNSNVYLFGRNEDEASGTRDLVYRKWTRSTTTLGSEIVIDPDVGNFPFVVSKRGHSSNRVEFIYTDGTASPYSVTYDGITLNTPPNKPPIVAPKNNNVVDRNKTIILDWEFSDPDTGDSQSKFELVYRVVGTTTWSRVVASTTNTYHALSPGTLSANDYEWQVRTYDQAGEVSPWADMAYFTAANPPTGHSITDPVVNQTIATEQYTVQWSASGQRKYELRRVADNGAGAPDTNNVLYTTGIVTSGTTRSRTLEFPTNNQTEHIQLRYSDDTGLWSTWDSVSVTISYTTPPSPSVTAVGNDLNGYIAVAIDNPTPAAGEPSIVSNNLFRREEGSRVVKIAEGLIVDGTFNDYRVENRKNYEYQAQAIGDNGTTALSAWAG